MLLGATAAKALLGNDFRLTEHRGEVLSAPEGGYAVLATPHPSSVLRGPSERRAAGFDGLVHDLAAAAALLSADR